MSVALCAADGRSGKLRLAAREFLDGRWFTAHFGRIGEQRWTFDETGDGHQITYRTNPRRRISDAHRQIVRIYQRLRGAETEQWPDGRPVIYQPLRLIAAFHVLNQYWAENTGAGT